jgi:ligand-binding sensor domain-containing protein
MCGQRTTEDAPSLRGDRPKLTQTRDGTLWKISNDPGGMINRLNGQTWEPDPLGDNIHASILETSDGVLWVGGFRSRLYALRDKTWEIYRTPTAPIPQNRITSLIENSDGALWFASQGQEAFRLDYKTDRWTTYEGLRFHDSTDNGTLYFVSQDSGVVRFNGNEWMRFGPEDELT